MNNIDYIKNVIQLLSWEEAGYGFVKTLLDVSSFNSEHIAEFENLFSCELDSCREHLITIALCSASEDLKKILIPRVLEKADLFSEKVQEEGLRLFLSAYNGFELSRLSQEYLITKLSMADAVSDSESFFSKTFLLDLFVKVKNPTTKLIAAFKDNFTTIKDNRFLMSAVNFLKEHQSIDDSVKNWITQQIANSEVDPSLKLILEDIYTEYRENEITSKKKLYLEYENAEKINTCVQFEKDSTIYKLELEHLDEHKVESDKLLNILRKYSLDTPVEEYSASELVKILKEHLGLTKFRIKYCISAVNGSGMTVSTNVYSISEPIFTIGINDPELEIKLMKIQEDDPS